MATQHKINLKAFLTVVYLLGTFAVTAATSKGGRYTPPKDRITNYQVSSTYPDALALAQIRVNNSTIVDGTFPVEFYSDGSDRPQGHREFKVFGFQYAFLLIGKDEIGSFELTGKNCRVRGQSKVPNNEYDPALTQYWFANPGFYTQTTYDCHDNGIYKGSIVFEELSAGDFLDVID